MKRISFCLFQAKDRSASPTPSEASAARPKKITRPMCWGALLFCKGLYVCVLFFVVELEDVFVAHEQFVLVFGAYDDVVEVAVAGTCWY